MLTKDLQIEILDYLEEFEAQSKSYQKLDIEDFASFILSKSSKRNEKVIEDNVDVECSRLDVDLSKNLTFLGRYIKYYMHKVVNGSGLQTGDEYSYLMTLLHHESLNKTELNNLNVFEKTSGNEVIRRLIKNGMVEEFGDVKDRRSKRIRITDKGREELEHIISNLRRASYILCHPLSVEEKLVFNEFLERILKVHDGVFNNYRSCSLDEITELIRK